MGKRVVVGLIIAAILLAGAYVASRMLFADEPVPAPAPRVTVVADAGRADAAPPDAATQLAVVVTTVEGVVERVRPGGATEPLKAGMTLDPDDSVRTGADGTAVLDVGGVAVELDRDTTLAVPRITVELSRVRLGEGRVAARVPRERAAGFGVAADKSDAIAEAVEGGQFGVVADGNGKVAVDVQEGRVRVSAKNESIEVGPQQRSIVEPNAAPSAPKAIPSSLFLKVRRPDQAVQRGARVAIRGAADPGAIVTVGGKTVKVGPDGVFETVVSLNEGNNRIVVSGRDASGNDRQTSVSVRRKTVGPNVGVKVKWKK